MNGTCINNQKQFSTLTLNILTQRTRPQIKQEIFHHLIKLIPINKTILKMTKQYTMYSTSNNYRYSSRSISLNFICTTTHLIHIYQRLILLYQLLHYLRIWFLYLLVFCLICIPHPWYIFVTVTHLSQMTRYNRTRKWLFILTLNVLCHLRCSEELLLLHHLLYYLLNHQWFFVFTLLLHRCYQCPSSHLLVSSKLPEFMKNGRVA